MERQIILPAQGWHEIMFDGRSGKTLGGYDIWAGPRKMHKIFFQPEVWGNVMIRTKWDGMSDEWVMREEI